MKLKSTLLACAFLVSGLASNAQDVWDDFDNPENVSYFFFNGTDFQQAFTNPNTGGVNSSALCAKYDRDGGSTFDVIVMDPAGTLMVDDVSDYVSGTKTMSLMVFSPAPGKTIQITLEDANVAGPANYPAGRHSEYLGTTATSNAWEVVTFSLSNQPDLAVANTSINRLVLLFDPNSNNSDTYLWDDLMGPEFINPCAGVTPDVSIGDDFECQRHVTYDFANGTLNSSIANPMNTGNNTSSTCGKFTKWVPPTNDGAFGGTILNPFTTATYNEAHIDLFSPAAPQEFLVIFQDASNADVLSTTFNTSSSTDWETFTIDLSTVSTSTSIEKIVFLLDPTTATEDTIYFDNFVYSFNPNIGIETNAIANEISVYPLPFDQQFNIQTTTAMQTIQVADLTGKTIARIEGLNQLTYTVDAATYASGAYILTITDVDGNVFTRKLLK